MPKNIRVKEEQTLFPIGVEMLLGTFLKGAQLLYDAHFSGFCIPLGLFHYLSFDPDFPSQTYKACCLLFCIWLGSQPMQP